MTGKNTLKATKNHLIKALIVILIASITMTGFAKKTHTTLTNSPQTTQSTGVKTMTTISQQQIDENLRGLINENHDLADLDSKVETYLLEAKKDDKVLRSDIDFFIKNAQFDTNSNLENSEESLAAEMQNIFSNLKSDLLSIKGHSVSEDEENPMLGVMLNYKKSLFKVKESIDETVAEFVSSINISNKEGLEHALQKKLLNTVKIKALSGLAELKETNLLHKILLKLTFSLASIGVNVPFIEWAPKHVVDQFWLYLEIQRRDNLKVPFFEFYKDPTPYTH